MQRKNILISAFLLVFVCLALVLVLGAGSAAAGSIAVDSAAAGCVASPQGNPYVVTYCTIQDAITDAASGDTINIANGTYVETLDIAQDLTLIGASQAGVVIDTSTFSDYGIDASGDIMTVFQQFTLIGPLPSAFGYGIKVSGENAVTTIQNVTVQNSGRSGIDLNGLIGGTVDQVTLTNNGGVGLGLTDCDNITISNITTSGNAWGGVGIFTYGRYHTGGSDGVSLSGTNSFAEANKLYIEEGNYNNPASPYPVTNFDQSHFDYTVKNDTSVPTYTFFAETEADAIAGALALTNPEDSFVNYLPDGSFIVGPGMSIQAAIDAADPGDTINVRAGTYAESLSIDKPLSLIGAGMSQTIVQPTSLLSTGTGHKYTADMQVTMFVDGAAGVTVQDMTIDGNDLAGGNAVVFWNDSSGTLQDVKIMRPRPFDGVQTGQGLAVDATAPGTSTLDVIDCDFEQWNKNAIDVVNGNSSSTNGGDITVNVNGGSFTGRGSTITTAQNAILFWERAGGTIDGSVQNTTISDIEYSPAGTEASGVLQYGSPNGTMTVSGNTFSNVEMAIALAGGSPNGMDASTNTFDGVTPATATLAQLFAIMDQIEDGLDYAGNGAVRIKPAHLYVTALSGSIQRAINLADPADTIVVQEGTYPESLLVDKSLALTCAQAGNPVGGRTAGSASETIIDATGLPAAITIKASDVAVDGCDIVGDQATYAGISITPTTGSGDLSNVDVANNFVHGMALPNPNSNYYVTSYGLFSIGEDVGGTRRTLTDLDVLGNKIYDIGGVASGADISAGAGVWLFSLQGAAAGDGATVSGNLFDNIQDGLDTSTLEPGPEPGAAVVLIDDGDGVPDTGGLVTGNQYSNTFAGAVLATGTSSLEEQGSDFSNVTTLALNVLNVASVNETSLAPFAKTDSPTGYAGSTAYFARVKDAIDNSDTGATVTVTAGTFDEGPQLLVDKEIDLAGAGSGATILKPTSDTGASGDARAWFLVDPAGSLDISGMTLDGTGYKVYQAIRYKGTAGSVSDVAFKQIRYNESGPTYAGVALAAFGSGPVDVTGSTFSGIGRIGVLYFGAGVSGSTFSGNTYTGKGVGDWLDYALDISAGAVVDVGNNSVSGNRGVASSDGSTSAGFMATTYFGPGTTATFTDNILTDNSTGIVVGYDGSDASTVVAHDNCFSLNDYGVETTAPLVDAVDNWWGSVTGPYNATSNPGGTGDEVTDNVDFVPWLDSCGGTSTGNFQNEDTGTFYATMQAAVDDANSGETIIPLAPGPFGAEGSATVATDGVSIKLLGRTFGPGSPAFTISADNVTILGPGAIDGDPGATGSNATTPGILVQPGADNFTLKDVEVTHWLDGVHVTGAVTSLKIVANWMHSNTESGLQVDGTPGGIVTIEGNLFKVNGQNGVVYGGGGQLDATYNSWGDLNGPNAAQGDGADAGTVDFDPWTFAEVFLDVDPPAEAITRTVPENSIFDVELKLDASYLYGVSFLFTYDSAWFTLNAPPVFTSPWSGRCVPPPGGAPPAGTVQYVCNLQLPDGEYTADGGTIATFNFTSAVGPAGENGPWNPVFFDISQVEADTGAGATGGVKVFVNNAGFNDPSSAERDITDDNDGDVIVAGVGNFAGFIDLQGRFDDSGGTLSVFDQLTIAGSTELAAGSSNAGGAYVTSHIAPHLLIIGSLYYLQVDAPLYLPTTALSPVPSTGTPADTDYQNADVLTTRPETSVLNVLLYGGDAWNDNRIDLSDATCIGGHYGSTASACDPLEPPGSSPDVNADGQVDLLDLVLMGGNYERNKSPWSQSP